MCRIKTGRRRTNNILSKWVKSKDKLITALKGGSNIQRPKINKVNHDSVDKAVFKQLPGVQSQNIAKSRALV